MQSTEDVALLFLRHNPLRLVFAAAVHVVGVEPRLEDVEVVKDLRHDEVEQGPQLVQVVLQGRAGQQQPVGAVVGLEVAHQLAVGVLQPVPLVHHDVLPGLPGQNLGVDHGDVVGGDEGRHDGFAAQLGKLLFLQDVIAADTLAFLLGT